MADAIYIKNDENIFSLLDISDQNLPGIDERVTRLEDVAIAVKDPIATGSTTARSLTDRFADVINVKDFGAKGDGVTNDTAAIQAAFDAAHEAGGGCVYLPAGVYRKPHTGGAWKMYSNTTMMGDGDASVIFYDATDAAGNPMLRVQNDATNVAFRAFRVKGTLEQYPNETNASVTIFGHYISGVRLESVTFENLRFFAFAMQYSEDVVITNCSFNSVLRDGVHFENSHNVRVANCSFYRVADDAVSISQTDNEGDDGKKHLSESFVITGNTFEASQGIQISGTKNVVISNNVMTRSLRRPIVIHNREMGNIYYTGIMNYLIEGNIILDTIGNRGGNTAILITNDQAPLGTAGNTSSPKAGDYSLSSSVALPIRNVRVVNNVVGWTLPTGVAYSSYERGLLLDRVGNYSGGTAGFTDPTMNDDAYLCKAIVIEGAIHELEIANNHIYGSTSSGANWPAIAVDLGSVATGGLVVNARIQGNTIKDWPSMRAIAISNAANRVGIASIDISGNLFDLDPYFRNSGHTAANKWTAADKCTAVYASMGTENKKYGTITGNTFKSCSQTVASGAMTVYGNRVFFSPASGTTGLDDKADNLGVRKVVFQHSDEHVIIDGDPTSASYGAVLTMPLHQSSAMPTSGTYVFGDFVAYTGIELVMVGSVKCRQTGWRRLKTGDSHVLGTDWRAEYVVSQ